MRYSLQLYSVVDEMNRDFAQAVRRTAAVGYDGVEFAGFAGLSAPEVKALLEETGLTGVSSHCGAEQFGDAFAKTLDYHRALGCQYIVLPYYGFAAQEDLEQCIALLNQAGDQAAAYGIKVGYHNHGHEFDTLDGKVILDEIAARTNDHVVIQLDVYWAAYAGVDPAAWIRKWGKKVELLHLRQIGPDRENCDLPDGPLDMAEIIRAADYAKEFTVEQEMPGKAPEEIWASLERNAAFLKGLNL